MEINFINILSEFAYIIVVFTCFFSLTLFFGRQMLINIICGLFLSLLLVDKFPYYDFLLRGLQNDVVILVIKIIFFISVTVFATLFFRRLMPPEYSEGRLESFWKKFFLAFSATILVMIFSFSILPLTEILTFSSPLQIFFSPPDLFFAWLLIPILILAIV